MNLSKNLTLEEFEKSDYASNHQISNFLPPQLLPDAIRLATKLFQPIRELLDVPMKITSGYRSPALNVAVRGVNTSQHTLAQAFDFIPQGMTIDQAFAKIVKSKITFDQLIREHDANGNIWIHISLKPERNRMMIIPNPLKKNNP